MFSNSLEYLEDLIKDEHELEVLLDNKPERFAVLETGVHPGGRIFKQSRVDSLLWAYRDIGYLYAELNPLGKAYTRDFTRIAEFREESYHKLSLDEFGLSESDLDTEFFGGKALGRRPLKEILALFKQIYCSSVGIEFLHIQNRKIREWLIDRTESGKYRTEFPPEQKRIILQDLIKSDELENFLQRTFIGQTRFSIQGAEAVISSVHFLADSAYKSGIEEIVIGTSHRGRLSILNSVLNLSAEDIFYRFEENFVPGQAGGSGDVRYHIGYCTMHRNEDGTSVNITLLPNSSHLESVNPVVEGNARGLQDLKGDQGKKKVMPLLIHGDASFSAQGIVAETFNLSRLRGYATGGTIHIVINNQIGFTTPPEEGRSGLNPTDIAKMLPVPILHVNGDDPEAVLAMVQLALEYRQVFQRDVVVDIYCFRRFGHNEGDEPSFTQPQMYALIKDHEGLVMQYQKKCLSEGIITEDELSKMREKYKSSFTTALKRERDREPGADKRKAETKDAGEDKIISTAAEEELLRNIAKKITTPPPDFNVHSRLKKIIENNYKRFSEDKVIDWAMAESLAFGTLLLEGIPVRLSGQDSERGTFSQRHLVWVEAEKSSSAHYIPLANLSKDQAAFSVYDSPLSEYSVLGFEYGYATARRDSLVIWEAQYGDFVNGGQVIIDNYIIAGQSKWNIENGLVMLLPHGWEGMGPEHSSGHLERFLQLCSDNNISVCNVTTPAQYFHLLCLHIKRQYLIPLVIMTPKSLLRNPAAVSALPDLSKGNFHPVLNDSSGKEIKKLLFCSGKIYYDLMSRFDERHKKTTGIVRVERLHPFPGNEIESALRGNKNAGSIFWVQEEPRNRGAWQYMREQFGLRFPELHLQYIGREASASPATGSLKEHNIEQQRIIARALEEI